MEHILLIIHILDYVLHDDGIPFPSLKIKYKPIQNIQ